jgi:SAM-dependent methyltransferase
LTEPPTSYDPHRFRTAVPYYARYRLNYPPALIERVTALLGLEPGGRVLDLGCGPGLLAIAFAERGMAVTAVDPEPAMLDAARQDAAEAGIAVDIRQGSSFDLPPGIGPFRLVTMGRAFHWMDRARTAEILDGLVEEGGGLALFGEDHPRTVENRWRDVLTEVGMRYGAEEASHRKERKDPNFRSHESILLDSPFSRLERISVVLRLERTVDDIVGLAYSHSITAPQALGERTAAFEAELRAELAALSPEGRFVEIAELEALIARR